MWGTLAFARDKCVWSRMGCPCGWSHQHPMKIGFDGRSWSGAPFHMCFHLLRYSKTSHACFFIAGAVSSTWRISLQGLLGMRACNRIVPSRKLLWRGFPPKQSLTRVWLPSLRRIIASLCSGHVKLFFLMHFFVAGRGVSVMVRRHVWALFLRPAGGVVLPGSSAIIQHPSRPFPFLERCKCSMSSVVIGQTWFRVATCFGWGTWLLVHRGMLGGVLLLLFSFFLLWVLSSHASFFPLSATTTSCSAFGVCY